MKDIRNIGIIQVNDGLGLKDTLEKLGFDIIQLNPYEGEWPRNLDLFLIPGPFYPLSSILSKISEIAKYSKPKIAIWLTEQHPSGNIPGWYLRFIGNFLKEIASSSENLTCSNKISKILRQWSLMGTRHRLTGEIYWLYKKAYLNSWPFLHLLIKFTLLKK